MVNKKTTTPIEHSVSEAVRVISEAALKATTTIASAAKDAANVVSARAQEQAKENGLSAMDDHNFLLSFSTEVKTRLDMISEDIKDLKDGTSRRIDSLEAQKLDTKDSYPVLYKTGVDSQLFDHNKRLTDLEQSKIRINVTIGIASAIMTVMIGLIIQHVLR